MSILTESLAGKLKDPIRELFAAGPGAARPGRAPARGLSHVAGSTDDALWRMTVPELLARTVERYATRDAAVFAEHGVRFTWSAFAGRVDALAAGLLAIGLGKGDRIGIWSPNRPEWLLAQFATARIGLILVTINPAYRLEELEYALNKSGCRALIAASRFKSSDYLSMIRTLAPEIDSCEPGRLCAARLPVLRSVIRLGAGEVAGMLNFDSLADRAGPAQRLRLDAVTRSLEPDDPINIQFQMSGPRALIEGVFGGRFPRDFGELGGILGVDTAAEMGRTVLNPISGSEVPMNTLPMRPTEAVQIGNSCFSFVKRDGRVEYFSNLEPFDFHADDQREARLLRIAKFAESGVRRSDLVEALGVSRSTVQRAVNQLRRDGEASFFAPRRGRGPSVIDAAMARTVNRLLVSGLSGAAVAREVGISSQTLNNNRRAGGVGGGKPARAAKADPDPEAPAEREAPQDAPERDALEPPIDRSARDARDRAAPMGRGARDTTGRMLAATGHLSETRPQFAEPLSAVAGGGGGG